LPEYFTQEPLPEQNEALQVRIRNAGTYFQTLLTDDLLPLLCNSPTDTDNKQVRTDLLEAMDELEKELTSKRAAFARCATDGFDALAHQQTCNRAELDFIPNRKRAAEPTNKTHKGDASNRPSSLYFELMKWRNRMAEEHNSPAYFIMGQQTITEIATKRPDSVEALAKIKGIGKAKAKRIGEEILGLVRENPPDGRLAGPTPPANANVYARARDAAPRPARKKDDAPVYEETLKLYLLHGKSIPEIARQRGVTEQTIENHLARCVNLGLIPVQAVVDQPTLKLIYETFGRTRPVSLTEAIAQLDGRVTYADLRFAYADTGN
jgi:HRDC domain/Helix-turn-helix domain